MNSLAQLDVALDRPMPQSPDAERAVLGSILINNRAFYRVQDVIDTDDFFKDAHRTIWTHFARMVKEGGQDIEPLTLKESLAKSGQLDQIGGAAYISSLLDMVPDVANVERYAQIVRDRSKLRRLIMAGNRMMRAALEPDAEPESIAADAVANLTKSATIEEAKAKPLYEVIEHTFDVLEKRRSGEAVGSTLTSGIKPIDDHRALRRTFIAIGCPSQHGKTALGVALGEGLAAHGHATCLFSLESTEEETSLRYVSSVGEINHTRIQDWTRMEEDDYRRAAIALRTAKQRQIYLTRSLRSVEQIYSECRRLKTLHGLDAAVIDYFQLVRMPGGPRDIVERGELIAQRMLEMAIDLNIGVIAMSQLNEDRKKRADGRLHQSDLKWAKALGETARVVMMFQRPYADDKKGDAPPCKVLFQIEKNNEGRTNDFDMHFDETTQRFTAGGCEENDCRRLVRSEPTTEDLFNR